MFTGLVERVGTLSQIETTGEARHLKIALEDDEFLSDAQKGESISINGICLTVTEFSSREFSVVAVEETLRRTNLGLQKVGNLVNLERAMKVGARLGGHIVQGHVDGVATVVSAREEGEGWWVSFEPPFGLMRYIVEKGSICLDGISLTVANTAYRKFSVALIPHTRQVTTAERWETGVQVNVEVDIVAKYVERLTNWNYQEGESGRT